LRCQQKLFARGLGIIPPLKPNQSFPEDAISGVCASVDFLREEFCNPLSCNPLHGKAGIVKGFIEL
jgi:hypothetical protein